jgi:maleate cis-trans isomerase
VLCASNFVDQGFIASQEECKAAIWCFDGDLASKSMADVAEQAPNADAYFANGMCNFRSGSNGQAQRFVHLEVELEAQLGKPVITHDNALYWRIYKSLGLAAVTQQGSLLSSLKD